MKSNGKLSKNIIFYSKEVNKWEKRIPKIVLVIILQLFIMNTIQLYFLQWNFANYTELNFYSINLLIIPLMVYLRFCIQQYNSFKILMNMYRFEEG